MKKIITPLLLLLMISSVAFSQTDTLKGEAANKLVKEIAKQNFSTAAFLSESGRSACLCIDSISLTGKSSAEVSKEIGACIDRETTTYQLVAKIYQSMVSDKKDNKLEINANKNSQEYKQHYFEIETWLRDSCKSLNKAVASENRESEVSFSKMRMQWLLINEVLQQ